MADVLTSRVFDLGARYRVHHWSLVASVQCLQCEAQPILRVVDGQETSCPSCGAIYSLGGLRWDVSRPAATQIAVAASLPTRRDPALTPS